MGRKCCGDNDLPGRVGIAEANGKGMEGDRLPTAVGRVGVVECRATLERRATIERVPDDRHPAGSGLDPQLVHPSGDGSKFDQPPAGRDLPEYPRDGDRLPPRWIVGSDDAGFGDIGALGDPVTPFDGRSSQGLRDGPGGKHCDIRLRDLATLELPRKLTGGAGRRRHEEDARHSPVEPVGDAEVGTCREEATEPSLD
jgi:hypothetical protein